MAFVNARTDTLQLEFTSVVAPVIQQNLSRTAPSVMMKSGLKGATAVEIQHWFGKMTLNEISDLSTPRATTYGSQNSESRWLEAPKLYNNFLSFYDEEKLLTLVDFTAGYSTAMISAIERKKDSLVIKQARGYAAVNLTVTAATSTTPQTITAPSGTYKSLPTGNGGNIITAAATDTPTGLLDTVAAALLNADVDISQNPIWVYSRPSVGFLEKLMADPVYQKAPGRYGNQQVDVTLAEVGDYKPYRGMEFRSLSNDVFTDSGITEDVVIIAGKDVCLGVWEDVKTTINQNPAMQNIWQVEMKVAMSATRLDEIRVYAINSALLP